MPTLANITINDGATTPVARTYNPARKDSDVFVFGDRVTSGGVPIGMPMLKISLTPPTQNGKVYRLKLTLDVPTLDVTSPSTGSGIQPAPTVGYTCVAKMELLLPSRSTTAERANAIALAGNLLKHSAVVAMAKDLEAFVG